MIQEKQNEARSWVLMLAGLAGIGYQQYTGEVDLILLTVFTLMSGVPGAAHIISLIRNSPTVESSSSSPEESSGTGSGESLQS